MNLIVTIGMLCFQVSFVKSQNLNIQIPLSITYDVSYYLSSTGGPTANGCQAWATVLSTKEYIYASKCDTARLGRLSFNIQDAFKFNGLLPANQQIGRSDEYYMVDYTDIKHQALFGETQNMVLAQIILNDKKQFIFLKYEGKISQLKECGLNLDNMLETNSKMQNEFKIKIVDDYVSLVKNMKTKQTYLIGTNDSHEVIALIFNEKYVYMGYSIKN